MKWIQIKSFAKWTKIVKYMIYKMFKIRGTSCYDINVTCIYFPKDDLLKFLKFEFRVNFRFYCIWDKKIAKMFSVKTWWRFDMTLPIYSIGLFCINTTATTNDLLKLFQVLHEKMEKPKSVTVWKVSVFRVILVRISPHSHWILTKITPNTGTFYAVCAKIITLHRTLVLIWHLKDRKSLKDNLQYGFEQ